MILLPGFVLSTSVSASVGGADNGLRAELVGESAYQADGEVRIIFRLTNVSSAPITTRVWHDPLQPSRWTMFSAAPEDFAHVLPYLVDAQGVPVALRPEHGGDTDARPRFITLEAGEHEDVIVDLQEKYVLDQPGEYSLFTFYRSLPVQSKQGDMVAWEGLLFTNTFHFSVVAELIPAPRPFNPGDSQPQWPAVNTSSGLEKILINPAAAHLFHPDRPDQIEDIYIQDDGGISTAGGTYLESSWTYEGYSYQAQGISLIKFYDLPAANREIKRVRLALYNFGSALDFPGEVQVREYTRPWNEDEFSRRWLRGAFQGEIINYLGPLQDAVYVPNQPSSWIAWDITPLYKRWLAMPESNNGVALVAESLQNSRYYSSDNRDPRVFQD